MGALPKGTTINDLGAGGENRGKKFKGPSPGKKNLRGLPEQKNFKRPRQGKKIFKKTFLRKKK